MTLDRLAKKILDDARVEKGRVPFRLVLQYRDREEGQYVGVAEVSGRVETPDSEDAVRQILQAALELKDEFRCNRS